VTTGATGDEDSLRLAEFVFLFNMQMLSENLPYIVIAIILIFWFFGD
jgi:hypothetical protein